MAIINVGRSLQKVIYKATKMNIATCWIGPGADHGSIIKALGSAKFHPARDHIICVCAIGYKSIYNPTMINLAFRTMNSRLPLHHLFFSDSKMTLPVKVDEPPFDAFRKVFEACQWSPSSFNSQTTRCRAITTNTDSGCCQRFDFFCSTASRYYAQVALGIWLANFEMGCQAMSVSGSFSVLQPISVGEGTEETREAVVPPFHYDVSWVTQA